MYRCSWTSDAGRSIVLSSLSTVALLLTVATGTGVEAAPWTQFRGAQADGIAADGIAKAPSGTLALQVAWKKRIGSGYSGAVIADGRAVTMFSDGKNDVMAAFSLADGRELWRFDIEPTYPGHDGSHGGPIATPAIHGSRVFGLGRSGRLFALDATNGALAWSTDLAKDHGAAVPFYGFGASPTVYDGTLIVELGKEEGGAIAGFDLTTGKRSWAVGDGKVAYQTPVPLPWNGRSLILATGAKKLFAIAPKTGELVWQVEHGGSGGAGISSLVPVRVAADRFFLTYQDDSSAMFTFAPGGADDGGVKLSKPWENRSIRNTYNVPIFHDGHLYSFSARFLTCLEAATGERKWRSRPPGDGFLILAGAHLVIITKNGSVHLVEATPEEYRETAGVEVFADQSWSPPSFADGHIVVRSMGEIARVDVVRADHPSTVLKNDQPKGSTLLIKLAEEVAAAKDKSAAVVDRFIAAQKIFPVIEGQDFAHFIYRGPAEDVALAGDLFGARQESPMSRLAGTDLFYYTARLEPDARLNYLFVVDYEQKPDERNPRRTTTSLMGKDMEMSFDGEMEMSWMAMPAWAAPAFLTEPTPDKPRGTVHTHELNSELLKGKHTIHVYVPAGYDGGTQRYPLLLVHDGVKARDKGAWPTALDNLLGESVAPLIAVFIDQDFFESKDVYPMMVATELVPFVDREYRTIKKSEARAHVGAGFAGYAAMMCTAKHPDVAFTVATQSAFMFDSMMKELAPAIPNVEKQQLRVYQEWGKYDFRNPHERWDMSEANRATAKAFKDRGHTVTTREVNDGTGWSSWRNRTDQILTKLFPAKE